MYHRDPNQTIKAADNTDSENTDSANRAFKQAKTKHAISG